MCSWSCSGIFLYGVFIGILLFITIIFALVVFSLDDDDDDDSWFDDIFKNWKQKYN